MSHGNEAIQPTQEQLNKLYDQLRKDELELEEEFNQNTNKMNQPILSTVKSVQANGTFENQYGVDLGNGTKGFFKFEYQMEDGATVNANHKKPEPFATGEKIEYLITKPEYNSGNVSKPQDEQSSTQSAPTNNAVKQTGISQSQAEKLPGFALRYGTDTYMAQGLPIGIDHTHENVAAYTEAIADSNLKWLKENSK